MVYEDKYMYEDRITIKKIYQEVAKKRMIGEKVNLYCLVKSNRNMGDTGFLTIDDGSCVKFAQVVYSINKNPDYANFKMGQSLQVVGKIVYTPENKQIFEINADEISLIGDVDKSYPLQKKKTSLDYLRNHLTYRMRTNTFSSVFRVRSAASFAIHNYFHKHGFVYVHTPILTGNDCEGAGEAFKVVTDCKKPEEYFTKNATLTVSGQLHVEPFALEYQKVYTFGPTFRAEKSLTTKHAAEFWMIEPEVAYVHLDGLMDLMEDFLKHVTKQVTRECKDDFDFFQQRIDPTVKQRLKDFINKPFARCTYEEAIKILLKAQEDGYQFENKDIKFGMDLNSEHERYVSEKHFNCPVFLYNYPKDIKAFYMKQNDDGITVGATDLLVPNVGELCGASEREDSYEKLEKIIKEKNMNQELYQWYLDLRRNGGCFHSGFGLGFERYIMFLTGINNIRDTLPYPRTYKELEY